MTQPTQEQIQKAINNLVEENQSITMTLGQTSAKLGQAERTINAMTQKIQELAAENEKLKAPAPTQAPAVN